MEEWWLHIEDKVFEVTYNELPPSVNRWLIPVVRKSGGRTYPQMVETQESKDFKKMFTAFLKREVEKQGNKTVTTNLNKSMQICIEV